ncbi:type II secretion system protein GspM [Piscinibacter koreensis]|uniref:Type II secretion system protein M n=1 Tax=Piscinibacter koreensis TaxID=2742824 RepID=A0A7Y6TW46_9BURK|nr:type II secretion system protein GspM [Schlegelella koreensis]NUZ05616.1 type II secretion system protein M [Schlegelella koreensis]
MSTAAPAAESHGAPTLAQQARAAWLARTPSERQMLSIGASVVGIAIVWLIAVQPAWRTIRSAPAQLDQLDQQLLTFSSLAAEVTELRQAPPVGASQAAAALTAATERLGKRARLSLQGERAIVTLTGVTSEDLRSWLAEVRSAARARPVEMQLVRAGSGYNGSLTVTLGNAP